jgi:hypothetical protein
VIGGRGPSGSVTPLSRSDSLKQGTRARYAGN